MRILITLMLCQNGVKCSSCSLLVSKHWYPTSSTRHCTRNALQEMGHLMNGNKTLETSLQVIQVCKSMSVPVGLEQGSSSLMWQVPELQKDRHLRWHLSLLVMFMIYTEVNIWIIWQIDQIEIVVLFLGLTCCKIMFFVFLCVAVCSYDLMWIIYVIYVI